VDREDDEVGAETRDGVDQQEAHRAKGREHRAAEGIEREHVEGQVREAGVRKVRE
jgi:hypothetical protein